MKYIVTLADEYTVGGKIGVPVTIDGNHTAWICTGIELVPYTEPDLEAIKQESYQRGIDGIWDVLRKMVSLSAREFDEIFTESSYDDYAKVFENYTPNEVIKKIRQYELEKEDGKENNSNASMGADT